MKTTGRGKLKSWGCLLLAALTLFLFACGEKEDGKPSDNESGMVTGDAADTGSDTVTDTDNGGKKKEFLLKLGLDHEKTTDRPETAGFVTTAAAVVTNADGVITACFLDSLEHDLVRDGNTLPSLDDDVIFPTKRERGNGYGLGAISSIGREWYQQADAFEAYIIGMTPEEVAALPTKKTEGGLIADDEVLYAGCTIDIGGMLRAVAAACRSEGAPFTASSPEAMRVGLSIGARADEYSDAGMREDGHVTLTADYGAVVTDPAGIVLAAALDEAQASLSFDEDGTILADNGSLIRSKRELGDAYGLRAVSSIDKEWNEQAAHFCRFVCGRTGVDVNSLATVVRDGRTVAADEVLYAGCTVAVDGFRDSIARAIDRTKAAVIQ